MIAIILLGVMTAQAQSGAVPNLQLSSTNPGELTISWTKPNPAPSDYRVIWAKQDLDFPSYKNSNEANRGNEYPGWNRNIHHPNRAGKGRDLQGPNARPVHERRR